MGRSVLNSCSSRTSVVALYCFIALARCVVNVQIASTASARFSPDVFGDAIGPLSWVRVSQAGELHARARGHLARRGVASAPAPQDPEQLRHVQGGVRGLEVLGPEQLRESVPQRRE